MKCDGTTWCKADKHSRGCFASDNPMLHLTIADLEILDEDEEDCICTEHDENTKFNNGQPIVICGGCGVFKRWTR